MLHAEKRKKKKSADAIRIQPTNPSTIETPTLAIHPVALPALKMAIVTAPRSASDATRFTPTTPHADSKSSSAAGGLRPARSAAAASPSAPGRSGPFRRAAGRDAPAAAPPGGAHHSGRPGGGGGGGETPEQRVARLRAAHLRAQNASVSRFDKIVAGGRRVFDSAHHVTVVGLLGFTGASFPLPLPPPLVPCLPVRRRLLLRPGPLTPASPPAQPSPRS